MDRRLFLKSSSLAMISSLTHTAHGKNGINNDNMNYRRLGRTNMKISEISLGGSPVPPEAIFRRAIEIGVNYVDTSSSYMNGNSELTIGKVLKDNPGKLYVATKMHAGRKGYEPMEVLEKEVEGSLKRLGVDCVDILMIHGARTADIVTNHEVLNLFEKFKRLGKIRFSGVSCHRDAVKVLTPAIEGGHFDVINIAYNAFSGGRLEKDKIYKDYLQKSGIEQLINLAKKQDVGVVAMKTMAGGSRQELAEYRSWGVSLPQAKLKWVLENKYVSTAISEMVTFDILEENLAVCGSLLSADERTALSHHVTSQKSRTCQGCSKCLTKCPLNIAIPDILRYANYHKAYGKITMAKEKYHRLSAKNNYLGCDNCGNCNTACPNNLPIVKMLQTAHKLLS